MSNIAMTLDRYADRIESAYWPVESKLMLRDYTEYARMVSRAYEARPVVEQAAVQSWKVAAAFTERMFRQTESRVKIEFTADDPYHSFEEMNEAVERDGVMKVYTGFSEHPVWTEEENLKFRAVHDYQSHLAGAHLFTLRGEVASYNRHIKLYPRAAWPCLFTEIVGQTSYYSVHQDFPTQKVCFLYGFSYDRIGEVDEDAYEKNFGDKGQNLAASFR